MPQQKAPPRVVFFWNNFGPMHADRVDAVAQRLGESADCVGVEFFDRAPNYGWVSESRPSFRKETLFQGHPSGMAGRAFALLRAARRIGGQHWFLCHYERPEVMLLAIFLRLTGRRVFSMNDSKFDDYARDAKREVMKSVFLMPYSGTLTASRRSAEYQSFLGIPKSRIAQGYDTLSIKRIRQASGSIPAPAGCSFAERDFVIVARHVPKKNLPMAINAFRRFLELCPGSRRCLHLCGSGEGEAALREQIRDLSLESRVVFHGFLQTTEVAKILARGLALILPSVEEQFGLVVIEAQAMGLPVLISEVAGARDALVRNWQNGFVFEPDNPEALAQFMALLDGDEALWRRLCAGATASAWRGDVAQFADAVAQLMGESKRAADAP